jgi:outer membrane cobalamin receptor
MMRWNRRWRKQPQPGAGLLFAAGLVVLALTGCSMAGAGQGSGGAGSGTGPIERAHLEATTARNAHDLVQTLRPQWLRGRGATSLRSTEPTLPVVYVDGMRFGAVETLRQIGIESVTRIEYMSAADATNRYGTGHGGGVIHVQTRR